MKTSVTVSLPSSVAKLIARKVQVTAAKKAEVYGAVKVKGTEYNWEATPVAKVKAQLKDLVGVSLKYKKDWQYLGDLDAEDCDIFVAGPDKSFTGKQGLPDFIKFLFK